MPPNLAEPSSAHAKTPNPLAKKPSPPSKTPRSDWKTGEQLEFLLSRHAGFKSAQDTKTLDQFWRRVFEDWYHRWKLPSSLTPDLLRQYGTLEEARLMIQMEKNTQIKNWFNGRGRASEGGRGGLKLNAGEKRRLAPVQAYCSYAWGTTLWDTVLKRWEEEKVENTFCDDEDPPSGGSDGTEGHIPLAFKLKVAREEYEKLSDEEKNEIDRRREDDKKKHGLKIPEIDNEDERIQKLRLHLKNQPSIGKSLLRVLTNLEEQAGCVVQVLVASVDPAEGKLSIQKFCQGETLHGLKFEPFYGDEWNAAVQQKFKAWALRIFGEKGTKQRDMFVLPVDDASESEPQAAPTASSSKSKIPPKALSSKPKTTPKDSSSKPKKAPKDSSSKSRNTSGAASSKEVASIKATPSQKSASEPSEPKEPAPQPSVSGGPSVVPPPLPVYPPTPSSDLPQSTPVPAPVLPMSHISIDSSPITVPPSEEDMYLVATAIGVHQLLSQVATGAQPVVQPSPSSENLDIQPSQLSISPSELVIEPQVVIAPAQSASEHTHSPVTPTDLLTTPISSKSSVDVSVTSSGPTPKVPYRTRGTAAIPSQKPCRNSIDGAPEMVVDVTDEEEGLTVDIRDYISIASDDDDETHVSSSQKSADGFQELLPPPPDSQQVRASVGRMAENANHSTRTLPQLNVDKEDLPTWMLKKGQWEYVASTAGGAAWQDLLKVYMNQERRLEFTEMGATFTTKDRLTIIKEYFQYAHLPSRGDSVSVPNFGIEVAKWWERNQPEWRRSTPDLPQSADQWSYILSGGSKGAFLIILCLAWWDHAHGRYLEEQKTRRTEAEAAGAAGSFDDLPDHDAEWLKMVNDVTFVMRKAQDSRVPGQKTSGPSGGVKRKREEEPPTTQKRSTISRTRSRA